MVKKLQPKLRFRGFTDAWEPRKLKSLLQESTQTSTDKEILSVTVANGIYPAREGARESNPGESLEKYKVVHENDIVYNSMRLWQGAIAISHYEGIVSPAYTVCIPSVHINPDFISYLLKRPAALRMFYSLSQGNSKDTLILKYPLFSTIKFSLPAGREQYHIARLLRCVDQLIDAEKRKLDLLQKKKTALLRQIFERKLRFKGYDNPWNRHKLGSITDSYSGGTPPVSDSSYYGGDIPFIRSAEIANESTELFITQSGLAASSAKRVKKGDVLYALYGANSGNASFAKLDGAINQAVLSIRAEKGFSNSFIMYWLQRSKNAIIGTFLQGGQGNLSGSIVKKLSIQTPRIDEQERIGLFFIKIDSLITAETRKLDLLIDKKKALLQKMFV